MDTWSTNYSVCKSYEYGMMNHAVESEKKADDQRKLIDRDRFYWSADQYPLTNIFPLYSGQRLDTDTPIEIDIFGMKIDYSPMERLTTLVGQPIKSVTPIHFLLLVASRWCDL